MEIARQALVDALDLMKPGLASKEKYEQDTCFVFRKGKMFTFNGTICCRAASPFGNLVTGALPHSEITSILPNIPDENLTASFENNVLTLCGETGGEHCFDVEEIRMQLDRVESPPKEFTKLPADFLEAAGTVYKSAGKDDSVFSLVHIHPKWLEACDRSQITRWRLKTGTKKSILVPREFMKCVADLCMEEVAETERWIHFRNANLTMSCLHSDAGEFPDTTENLKLVGEQVRMSRELIPVAKLMAVHAASNGENDKKIMVNIRPGKVGVKGSGIRSRGGKEFASDWKGEPVDFMIAPELLVDLVEQQEDCLLSDEKLLADGGKWRHALAIYKDSENGAEKE